MTKQKRYPKHTKPINQYIMGDKHQSNDQQCPTQKKRMRLYAPIVIKVKERQKQNQNGHQKRHVAKLPERVNLKENIDFHNLSRRLLFFPQQKFCHRS